MSRRLDYSKRPRVGDVISYRTGPARVTRVHGAGERLALVDSLGRAWDAERAPEGTWVRLHRAPDLAVLASLGLAPLPARPANRERVVTWANGFGVWHAKILFARPYPSAFLACEADRLRNKARRAIRRELVARQGAPVGEVRVVKVDTQTDSIGGTWSVTYAEDAT